MQTHSIRLKAELLLAVAGMAAASPVSAQNFITNGSFETPGTIVGFYETAPVGGGVIPGWTVLGIDIARGVNGNGDGLAASDGTFFLDLTGTTFGGTGGVLQTIVTTPGTTYAFRFDLGTNEDNANLAGPISVTVVAAGVTMPFTHNPGGAGNQWSNYGFDFVATGASTDVSIQATAGAHYVGLDRVSVMTAVPEPLGSGVLAGLGLIGFGVWRRTRRGGSKS